MYSCEVLIEIIKVNGIDPRNMIISIWKNKEMNISCGNFKKSAKVENNGNFLHLAVRIFFCSLDGIKKRKLFYLISVRVFIWLAMINSFAWKKG